MTSPARHSKINRALDAIGSVLHPSRRPMRRALVSILEQARRDWPSADYGSGYLYQSFHRLGLRGFRNTEARRAQMHIGEALRGRSVLEIGCNSGFLSLVISPGTKRYLAFDNNPFLIDIAKLAQREIGDTHVEFRVQAIEALFDDERFDVVLSFANHSTWDGNMTLALEAYFAKLQRLLAPRGVLFFESHHPALEDAHKLEGTLACLARFFTIEERRLLVRGSAWDRGRTFVRARSRTA
jgi:SAM-dependent methyltransferase